MPSSMMALKDPVILSPPAVPKEVKLMLPPMVLSRVDW